MLALGRFKASTIQKVSPNFAGPDVAYIFVSVIDFVTKQNFLQFLRELMFSFLLQENPMFGKQMLSHVRRSIFFTASKAFGAVFAFGIVGTFRRPKVKPNFAWSFMSYILVFCLL